MVILNFWNGAFAENAMFHIQANNYHFMYVCHICYQILPLNPPHGPCVTLQTEESDCMCWTGRLQTRSSRTRGMNACLPLRSVVFRLFYLTACLYIIIVSKIFLQPKYNTNIYWLHWKKCQFPNISWMINSTEVIISDTLLF